MTAILAIDPGTRESAWTVLEDGLPAGLMAKEPNAGVLARIRELSRSVDAVVIEEVRSYGMPVGFEVLDTVRWTGRFEEAAAMAGVEVAWLGRKDVVTELCRSSRADDAAVRRVLLDRFGGDGAKGTKASPGPLHGVSGDLWSALALGCAWFDKSLEETA